MKVSQSLNINSYIHQEEKVKPIVGIYSDDTELSGWICEKDFFIDEMNTTQRYNTFVGGQKYNIKEGSFKSDWQSIVREGITFKQIEKLRVGNDTGWTPVYERGAYSIYWNLVNFYSSFHYSGIMVESNKEMKIKLDENCSKTSIEVAIWTRDDKYVKHPYTKYKYLSGKKELEYKGPFAYKKADGWIYPLYTDKELVLSMDSVSENSETRYGETILGVDNTVFYYLFDEKQEAQANNKLGLPVYGTEALEKELRVPYYRIENEELVSDPKYNIKIGTKETDSNSILKYWESKGKGNSNGRLVFTKYFPIAKGSLSLAGLNRAGEVINLKEVERISEYDNSEYIYSVDYDLGIVQIGGVQEPDLILADNLNTIDKEIKTLSTEKMKTYPDTGILKIGNELIFYGSKNYNTFFDCKRGFRGTRKESHNRGIVFQSIQNGKSIDSGNKIYCRYTAVPKVRYEVSDKTERYANKYGWLNLKPIYNVKENGIIQISSVDKNVADVKLEIDADLIASNIYGPIFYGTDFREFTARALDRLGNPVSDIEITIKFSYGPGYLGYSLREFTGISNSEGEIYTLYGVPYDWDSISKKVVSTTNDGISTTMQVQKLPQTLIPERVQVYQVMKHDPILGTAGKKMDKWISYNNNTPSWGVNDPSHNRSYVMLIDNGIDNVSKYELGDISVYLENPANGDIIRFDRTVMHSIDIAEDLYINSNLNALGGSYTGVKFLLKESIPQAYSTWDLKEAVVFERKAVKFSPINLNGARRVVYEWNDKAMHPITGNVGAYFPLRPSRISGDELIFDEKMLPIPEPNNPDSNVGGYLVICSDMAEFYAECVDPISGNVIKSNTIKVRIDIPEYLNGVSIKNGLPIPYGFKFAEDGLVAASGIGGATFLTINPFDNNILDLMVEII